MYKLFFLNLFFLCCGFVIYCLYVLLLFMICLSHLIMRNVFLQNVALSLVLLTTNYIDSCIFMHRFQCFSLISPGFWKSSQRFTCLCANVCVLFCFVVFQFICLNLLLGDQLFLGLCFHCFCCFGLGSTELGGSLAAGKNNKNNENNEQPIKLNER